MPSRALQSLAIGLTGLAFLLSACGDAGAPTDIGVCWRSVGGRPQERRFLPVARGVSSLDDCAAQLEAIHLEGAASVEGAFQGYFIFVDDARVTSAPARDGFRYPIFQPTQRKEIDADLRGLIKDRNGAAPSAGEIAVERR